MFFCYLWILQCKQFSPPVNYVNPTVDHFQNKTQNVKIHIKHWLFTIIDILINLVQTKEKMAGRKNADGYDVEDRDSKDLSAGNYL